MASPMVNGDGRHNGIIAALNYLRDKYRTRQQRYEDALLMVFLAAIGIGFIVLVVATTVMVVVP